MPRSDNRIFKDQIGGGLTSKQPAPRPAASSETLVGEMNYGAASPRKSMQRAEVSDSAESISALTPIQYRRIVASLAAGHGEKNISEAELVSELVVRRVRAAELDRRERQMNAVGLAFGGFLENVRSLHSEIDQAVFEELREGRAA